jgi:hypothetical protein
MRIRDQCLDGKTGDEKVDFALRRVLTHNASEYKSKLRWVVEAQRLGLHKGDEVAYRTSSRDQLAEIIGLPEYSSKKVLPKSSQFAEVQGSLHGIEEAYLTTKTKEVLEFNQDATFYRLAKAISGHSDVSLHSFFSKQKSRDEIRTYSQIVAAQQFSL